MNIRIAILAACAGTLALAASTGTFAKEVKAKKETGGLFNTTIVGVDWQRRSKANLEKRQTCCVATGDLDGDGFGRRRSKANINTKKETGGLFGGSTVGVEWRR